MELLELLTTFQRQLRNVAYCAAALGVLLALAWIIPPLPARRLIAHAEQASRRFAGYRAACIIFVGLISLTVELLVVAVAGPPIPHIHDEFSYLLAADTFARGRLTNPPHPRWRHFETMHVLFEPTYASKFHPAQGLTLALGQVVFAAPWMGAILSTAGACAALTWCLFGWTRPRWALLGGLICAVHPQVVIWGHQYWGGSVGMIGGTLVLGALPRILRNDHVARNAAWLVLGGAILATSRPFEGLVWGLLSAITLGGWLIANRFRGFARLAIPAAAVLIPVLAMMAYYNRRVTGNWRELPYTLHSRTYMSVPLLFWQSHPSPRTYLHPPLEDQHRGFEWRYFHEQLTVPGWIRYAGWKIYSFAELHLLRNLALMVGVLALPCAIRSNRWMWLACGYALAFIAAYGAIPWFEHHYAGAVMGLLFLLGLRGLRLARTWAPRGRRVGQIFVWLCIISTIPVLATVFAREYRNTHGNWWFERYKLEQKLLAEPGDHLVFVNYGPDHLSGQEWVYNSAEIDRAKVVWARQISPEEDQKLIAYFPHRKTWIVCAAERPARLQPLIRQTQTHPSP